MAKTTAPKKSNYPIYRVDLFLLELCGKFGVTGAVIICILYVFVKDGSLEQQHREFIDKFILFKNTNGETPYLVFAGIIIVIIFFSQNVFFKKRDKLKDEKIEQLNAYISKLEAKSNKK